MDFNKYYSGEKVNLKNVEFCIKQSDCVLLVYRRKVGYWWTWRESNPLPPQCECGALAE